MLIILLLLLILPASAKILSIPDEFESIQDALNSSNAGDTILIKKGVYNENLLISKPVRIVAQPEVSIVAQDKNSEVIKLLSTAILEGLNISGDIVGIKVVNVTDFKILNCSVSGAFGIVVIDSSGSISGCRVSGGIGVYIENSTVNIDNSNLRSAYISGLKKSVISMCTIRDLYIERSFGNLFYLNNFPGRIIIKESANFWNETVDEGKFGNYYATKCSDEDFDGICDVPRVFDDENIDHYPLKNRWEFYFAKMPDLTVKITTFPELRVEVSNVGKDVAKDFTVVLLIDNVTFKTWKIASLYPSKSERLYFKLNVSGYYEFKAIVDAENKVEEIDEDNNIFSIKAKFVPETKVDVTSEYTTPYLSVSEKRAFKLPVIAFQDTSIATVILETNRSVDVKLRIEKIKNVDLPAIGKILYLWRITPILSIDAKLKLGVEFAVPKTKEIDLFLYTEGWKKLDTEITGEDENYRYYYAESEDFGYFAVVEREKVEVLNTTTPKKTEKIPGFGVFLAISAIFIALRVLK